MARKYSKAASNKVERAMHERKTGTLKSGGSGKKVTSRKQAIAIGLAEARREGKKVPAKRSSSSRSSSSRSSSGRKASTGSPKSATRKSPARRSSTRKSAASKRSSGGRKSSRGSK
ncbi:MAG: DUF6496 domain-containing protein [Bauldia sp.]